MASLLEWVNRVRTLLDRPELVAIELTKFAELRDRGVLSEAEFAAKKAQILGL